MIQLQISHEDDVDSLKKKNLVVGELYSVFQSIHCEIINPLAINNAHFHPSSWSIFIALKLVSMRRHLS